MKASIIIRSKDEADRLRLTLTSLAQQTERPEVVIVNDGSSDHTRDVIGEAARELDLVAVHHDKPAGRSAAANAGARQATGDIVLFLDGDTMAAPDLVATHLDQHRSSPNLCVRGDTYHLRCTRVFLDPEGGTPRPGEESKVARMSATEREKSVVTRDQIRNNFAFVDQRAQPGIYPGFGPRKLYEMEVDALKTAPDCPVLWTAASGSNQSVGREAFLASGGYHPDISINEHRELALRFCESGLRMGYASGRTYHLIHRSGWRDPLEDLEWERIFYREHPIPEVALLAFLWASLSDPLPFPREACLHSLPELAATAARYRGIVGLEDVRRAHLLATTGKAEPA